MVMRKMIIFERDFDSNQSKLILEESTRIDYLCFFLPCFVSGLCIYGFNSFGFVLSNHFQLSIGINLINLMVIC